MSSRASLAAAVIAAVAALILVAAPAEACLPVPTNAAAAAAAAAEVAALPSTGGGVPAPTGAKRCFVANCLACSTFNPYLCETCDASKGYQRNSALVCQSCLPGFEQNLDIQTFTCVKCPDGWSSYGGKGEASQCVTCPPP